MPEASNVIAVYADGGVIQVNPSPVGGTWAFCHVDSSGHRVLEQGGVVTPEPGAKITNNLTEFVALVSALEALPEGWCGWACSDSGVTLGRLFSGWKLTNIPADWIERGARALKRLGTVTPRRLDGHPTAAQLLAGIGKRGGPVSIHNVWCDKECGRQAQTYLLRSA